MNTCFAFLAGMFTFLVLAHMFNATQLLCFLLGCFYVPCTCTHAQCYATTVFLAGMFTFLALAHMFNATQPLCFLLGCLRSLHLHTCSMLRNDCVKILDLIDFLIKYNFFDKNEEKKFGRLWQTNLHLQTLFTMVATSNRNVSSPKQS